MTSTTASTTLPVEAPAPAAAGRSIRLRDVFRGEWIKFRSVRSLTLTLTAAAVVTLGLGMIFSATAGSGEATPRAATGLVGPVELSLGAIELTALIVGVVGVLVSAGEYTTGLVRTTIMAVGHRLTVLTAKVGVVGMATALVMGVATVLTLWLGQAVYGGDQATLALTDPDAIGVVLGTTTYVTGVALIGLALGMIVRSTASAIGVLVGGVFIAPQLMLLLPESFTDVVLEYMPSEAGAVIMSTVSDPSLLSTSAAYAVLGAWVLGLLAVAGLLLRIRDV